MERSWKAASSGGNDDPDFEAELLKAADELRECGAKLLIEAQDK